MPKLFIGNIPFAADVSDLRRWVEIHGFTVQSAKIVIHRGTGQSRGFGFVEVEADDSRFQQIITALDHQRMGDRILNVREAQKKANQTS